MSELLQHIEYLVVASDANPVEHVLRFKVRPCLQIVEQLSDISPFGFQHLIATT